MNYMGCIIGFIHKTYYEKHFHEEKHLIQVFWKKEKLSLVEKELKKVACREIVLIIELNQGAVTFKLKNWAFWVEIKLLQIHWLFSMYYVPKMIIDYKQGRQEAHDGRGKREVGLQHVRICT